MAIITSSQQQAIATMASLSVAEDGLDAVPPYLVQSASLVKTVSELDEACHATSVQCLDALIEKLERGEVVDPGDARKALDRISKSTKSLHGAVSKLAKHVDAEAGNLAEEVRVLNTEVLNVRSSAGASASDASTSEWEAASRQDQLISALITEHLYTTGNFEAGDALAQEAKVDGWESIREPYIELLSIEHELQEHRLEKALAWVGEHQDILSTNVRYVENRLPFMLHRLQFLRVLEAEGQHAAVGYAGQHMRQFYRTHGNQLHMLLGGVAFREPFKSRHIYTCSALAATRYGFMYDAALRDELWAEAVSEFRRQFCFVIRKPQDSPLLVSVSAGSLALPTLLKFSKVAARTAISTPDQLPIELPLPDAFAFHSTFTCPVSKESNTPSDPAVALPCGHCLNKSSTIRIAKSPARRFKCPYCPQEAMLADCLELKFV